MLTFNSTWHGVSVACGSRHLLLRSAVYGSIILDGLVGSVSKIPPECGQLFPSSLYLPGPTHLLLVPGQVPWPPCWSSRFFAVSHVCSQSGGWRCMVCSLSDLEGLPLSPSAPPLVQEREHLVQGEPRGSPSAYSEFSLAFSFTSQHGKSQEPTGRDSQNIWPSLSGFLGPGKRET